jgi:VacB/RNase II family 3'-5' exoribonuclease
MDARRQRAALQRIARLAMLGHGMAPDFSAEALEELGRITDPPRDGDGPAADLRNLLWASIDNDDSRDLDQLSVAESLPGGAAKILVAVADVDALVRKGSAIDEHARQNTTSVYTAGEIFPMLPEKLSTDLTSLGFQEDRPAIVIELRIGKEGSLQGSEICRATVRNRAKLAYNSVASWLEGNGPMPEAVAAVAGLEANLRVQDIVAQKLKLLRHQHGALDLETIEARPVFDGEEIRDLEVEGKNRAKDLIEDFMIAANGVTARFLAARRYPSLRRVVRSPERWERIVDVAAQHDVRLPSNPDPAALANFLALRRAADPLRFPDLSLTIVKLMGRGEYVVEFPDEAAPGHFGLAVRDYTHSTAPNRRYPDLITQRLLKSALAGSPAPYGREELAELARHCTEKENDANKVERQVGKSAAAMLLESRIGERFDAIVTGASEKGTWVRLLHPPVEGKLIRGFEGADVGHRVRVQLVHTDVDRGHIDFKKVD